MATNYPVNPRVRAYGKARIDIAQRAQTPADWERLWKNPSYSFPFVWGEAWKQCMEYKVDDFAAEVGFFIDVLGLPVNAFSPAYAMFTSPQGDFFFSFIPTPDGEASTPPDAIRLQFMVADIFATTLELEQRGISFEHQPVSLQPGSPLHSASFRTPHGIPVDLWGLVTLDENPMQTIEPALTTPSSADNGSDPRLEGDDHDEEEAEELDEDEEEFPEESDEEEEDESEIEEDEVNGDGDIGLLEEDEEEGDEESLEGEEEDEGDEDLGEDEEDEDFDLDEDDDFDEVEDEVEDEDEDDEDDDDLILDEDRLASTFHNQEGSSVNSQPTIKDGITNSSGKLRIEIKAQAPEYIDLDIT